MYICCPVCNLELQNSTHPNTDVHSNVILMKNARQQAAMALLLAVMYCLAACFPLWQSKCESKQEKNNVGYNFMDIALISIFLGYYTIIKIIGIPWPLLASEAIETIAMSNLNLASEVTRGQRPVGVV